MNGLTARSVLLLCALAIAFGCTIEVGIEGWRCDVTITWNGRTVKGSGTGDTLEEAQTAAYRAACPKLGLTGDQLALCQEGRYVQLPGNWTWDSDCETT